MTQERTEFYAQITIEDVDRAIVTWFDRTVDAHVVGPNSDRVKVPVVFSSGERWLTGKERRGIRDKNGKLILPLIGIRRATIDPVNGMSALGVNVPRLQVSRKVSDKTNEIQNQIANRSLASRKLTEGTVYEVTTIPFPFNGLATYELVVQAQYIQQMNGIIEKVLSQLEFYEVPTFVAKVRDPKLQPHGDEKTTELEVPDDSPYENRKLLDGYYFVGFFDPGMSSGDNFDEFTDQERIVKYSTTFRVPIYLHLDPEGKVPAVRTERTAFKLGFGDEEVCFVDDPLELEIIFGPTR